ncbi:hypothetical protein Cni_G02030 [Canna indica]|uniref:HMA domain-containing protein n=1 Tax=Canna indica TaxID=4628 RepID=A0AAQ3JNN3_9LILI|nr:hypothetical protein Cni_G02030 [Canna indica]
MALESALSSPLPKIAVVPPMKASNTTIHPFLQLPPLPSSQKARFLLSFDSRRRRRSSRPLAGGSLWIPTFSLLRSRFASVSSCHAVSSPGGGGGGGVEESGGGGGGDGGSSGGESDAKPVAVDLEDAPGLDADVIVLHVGGMTCGGCSASVKRILEGLPQVSSATVNLEKKMAVIWIVPEAKVMEDWQQELGVKLAEHLTTCGFKSNIQDLGSSNIAA